MVALSLGLRLSIAALATNTTLQATKGNTTYSGADEANDITNGLCADISFIHARGSTETGNIGTTVGPAVALSLIAQAAAVGKTVAIQGVNYTATEASQAFLGTNGAKPMASLITQAKTQCPHTKVAISGYSQGASVVHQAATMVALQKASIDSVVVFGDVFNGMSVGSVPKANVYEFCSTGDYVCNQHLDIVTDAHWTYWWNGDQDIAAQFVVSKS